MEISASYQRISTIVFRQIISVCDNSYKCAGNIFVSLHAKCLIDLFIWFHVFPGLLYNDQVSQSNQFSCVLG